MKYSNRTHGDHPFRCYVAPIRRIPDSRYRPRPSKSGYQGHTTVIRAYTGPLRASPRHKRPSNRLAPWTTSMPSSSSRYRMRQLPIGR